MEGIRMEKYGFDKCHKRSTLFRVLAGFFIYLVLSAGTLSAAQPSADNLEEVLTILKLLSPEQETRVNAFEQISREWKDSFTPMILEIVRLNSYVSLNRRLFRLLARETEQKFGSDISRWQIWLWNNEPLAHPNYGDFKSFLYGLVDPKFTGYFSSDRTSKIRLDEVIWGGVRQDGIPPLRYPKMISVAQADYLDDENVVFGIEVNGDARAYPQRILAWHEMFVDEVGGEPVAGVYCTLCGAMILYKTEHAGVSHYLGTSGFLYRSNKLMYDRKTQSLWNTIWGQPVIGPLANSDITLERLSVVTTTWGEWRRRHPGTQVLSSETGHRRDYSEGAAYKSYFATDELMFGVPKLDTRLDNKAEVLGLVFNQSSRTPLAISEKYLSKNPLYQDRLGDIDFIVLTDKSGANRVFETKGIIFRLWDSDQTATDQQGVPWTMSESRLAASDGRTLNRLPAHRAFWFGWFSAYPQTRLVR